MNRRGFLTNAGAAAAAAGFPWPAWAQESEPPFEHRLPATDADYQRSKNYVEDIPIHQYHCASDAAVEDFKDIKFGLRIHWGIYSNFGRPNESWPLPSVRSRLGLSPFVRRLFAS